MVSLDDSVRNLSDLSRQLNDYTERLNAWLRVAEAELIDAGLGIELWLDNQAAVQAPDGRETRVSIGWDKFHVWGFFCTLSTDDSNAAPQRLLDAPRWVRIGAIPLVKTLIERLTHAAQSALTQFEAFEGDLPESVPPPAAPEAQPALEEEIPF